MVIKSTKRTPACRCQQTALSEEQPAKDTQLAGEPPTEPRETLEWAIENLSEGRELLTEVDSELVAGAPRVYAAEQGLQGALLPLGEAKLDTIETDVSYQGYLVQSAFRQVNYQLSALDRNLAGVITHSATFDDTLESLTEPLQGLREQLQDNPEALEHLDQALRELDQTILKNRETNFSGWRADNKCDYLVNATAYSIFADRIARDRIGTDVSYEADQLNSRVGGYISFHLADADRRVQSAQLSNQQAATQAGQAQSTLEQTLAVLDPSEPD